jgi:hypothetical protein
VIHRRKRGAFKVNSMLDHNTKPVDEVEVLGVVTERSDNSNC